MSSTDSIASSDHQTQLHLKALKHSKRKPRHVSSRYLSPPEGNNPSVSTVHLKQKQPVFERNLRISLDDNDYTNTTKTSLWPSSTSTLAEHLGNLRLKELLSDSKNDRLNPRNESHSQSHSLFLNHQRSCHENHKPVILGKSKLNDKASSSPSILPGRLSVDENTLSMPRKSASFGRDDNICHKKFSEICESNDSESSATSIRKTASFSLYRSPTTASSSRRTSGIHVSSKFMHDSTKSSSRNSEQNVTLSKNEDSPKQIRKSILKSAMRRANSLTGYRSVNSQWALSPSRTSSSMVSVENKGKLQKTYSNLKPPTSPQKSTKGVEKLLNMGMDLLKIKRSCSTSHVVQTTGYAKTESGHKLRLLYTRVMQWRFANAKAQVTCDNVTKQAEINLIFAQESLARLRQSVNQKRLKYQREKLVWKLSVILHSQTKLLEMWGGIERQHTFAVSMTKDSLLAVVCKVPLVEGAKVDVRLASLALRHASDLTASMKSVLTAFSPSAEETCMMLSELAEVVAQEYFLIQECLEMCKTISFLEVQERSLKSNLIQLGEANGCIWPLFICCNMQTLDSLVIGNGHGLECTSEACELKKVTVVLSSVGR